MDTIFHVAQPHGRPLNFSLTDKQIEENTFNAIKNDPTFCYMEEWREKLRTELNENT
jgi:catechol 2,3-dioxygenase